MLVSMSVQLLLLLVGLAWCYEKDSPVEYLDRSITVSDAAQSSDDNGVGDMDEIKRTAGWNKLQGGWGKREEMGKNWNRLNAVWGKSVTCLLFTCKCHFVMLLHALVSRFYCCSYVLLSTVSLSYARFMGAYCPPVLFALLLIIPQTPYAAMRLRLTRTLHTLCVD